MASEAHLEGNEIKFNGWVKWVLGFFISIVMAVTAYAYTVVLPTLTNNVIINDKDSRKRDQHLEQLIYKNIIAIEGIKSIELKIDAVNDDMREIKTILRRTAPFERKQP